MKSVIRWLDHVIAMLQDAEAVMNLWNDLFDTWSPVPCRIQLLA